MPGSMFDAQKIVKHSMTFQKIHTPEGKADLFSNNFNAE
jgi:hypothetical protein